MIPALFAGACSFALFVWFDWHKAAGSAKSGGVLFALGAALLSGATAALLFPLTGAPSALRVFCALWSAAWFLALLYVLFFALPAGEVYAKNAPLSVCQTGAYALCRHPGGWCMLFFYLGLWGLSGAERMGAGALVFSGLNFAYIALQDRVLFPRYIAGYAAYQKSTPFLVPTRRSISACFSKSK